MFKQAIAFINQYQNILILTHISQDGDTLGSSFALRLLLEGMGKKAFVMLDEPHKLCETLNGTEANLPLDHYDLGIAVDCGDEGRLGSRLEAFRACEKTIVIDHHNTNIGFGDVNCIDSGAAATAELIFRLAKEMDATITPEIATNLHLAIAADTGGFMYANVTPETMRIGAELLEKGAENVKINTLLFSTNSYAKLMLMKTALNSLEVYANGKIACISISQEQLEACGASDEECEGIIYLPRSLEGVQVSFFVREKKTGGVKISMRSSGLVDVSKICANNNGGGHKMAAGCAFESTIDEAKRRLVEQIESCF